MPERTQSSSSPAQEFWALIQEKTMLNGEKLPKFDTPEEAAGAYMAHLSREQLEKVINDLIKTLQNMRTEREDIFEKNSALEDAVGKLIKEKIYLQRQLASAINAMTDQSNRLQQLIEEKSQATALSQKDPEQ